jgi:hypothetical protein
LLKSHPGRGADRFEGGYIDAASGTRGARSGGVIMIVNTVDSGGGVMRIQAAGEIDMASVAQLDTAMTSAISAAGAVSVIVDMADVTFCDSSGIAAFDRNYFLASQASPSG